MRYPSNSSPWTRRVAHGTHQGEQPVVSRPVYPAWWTARFGETPPLGYRLRVAFADRWLRIHSLPNSKRYPESPDEKDLLLARHDAVARSVLPGSCTLVTAVYAPATVGERARFDGFGARAFECVSSYTDPGDPDGLGNDIDASIWAADTAWDLSADRDLLLAIAMDEARALWVAASSGEVFAPYDGGADIIARDPSRRAALQTEFADWLSPRDDGL